MNVLRINKTVFVDPDQIAAIRTAISSGDSHVILKSGEFVFVSNKSPEQIVTEIRKNVPFSKFYDLGIYGDDSKKLT